MTTKSKNTAYDFICHERRLLALWLIYHIAGVFAILIGLFFAYKYMTMPDRVIVLGRDRNVYLGYSAPVESEPVIRDIALRAAYCLLVRRYDYSDEKQLAMVFNKRGQGQARNYLSETQELFTERKLFQDIESWTIDTLAAGGQHFALIKGVLVRNGTYFGYPYTQKRDFALMMKLVRSETDFQLPFKVAGLRLYEEENTDD